MAGCCHPNASGLGAALSRTDCSSRAFRLSPSFRGWPMQNSLFQTLYFEDLAVGMRATIRKTVENEDVLSFAELSGDHNPIHLSEHFARKTRFGGRIVHGLYTASLISGVIGMRLPGPGAVYISQTLRFL